MKHIGLVLGFFLAACLSTSQRAGALERSIVRPMLVNTLDFRALVTQGQIDEYLAASNFDMWDLPIWRNERLKHRKDYFAPDGAIYHELTRAQQVLILVGQMDGDIGNGGIGQLFFNQAPAVPAMQEALAEMGCSFAADLIDKELNRLAETDFIPKWIEARARFAEGEHASAKEREQAWAAFMQFVDEMFPDDSINDAYFARSAELIECSRTYITGHIDELFEIVGP